MKLPLDHAYDFVFGLGQMCANATYMAAYGLRTCSSPFDWLDGSQAGLKVCVDLICRDFAGFLLKENLEPIPNPMGELDDRDCDYYFDCGTGFRVMHEFPRGVPLDASHPEVMSRLRRRIDRMYARVRESKRTLFVYWSRFESVPDAQLRELASRLRAGLSGRAVDLLVVEHRDSAAGVESVTSVGEGVVRVVGRFFVPRPDGRLTGDERLNGLVYGAIPKRLSLRIAGRRLEAKRTLVRALSLFCLGRARRKAFRKRMMRRGLGRELG